MPFLTSAKATKNAGSASFVISTEYCCAVGLVEVVFVNCCELPEPPVVIAILFQLEPPSDEYCICNVKLSGISAKASAVARAELVLEKPSPPNNVFKATETLKLVLATKVIDCQEAEVSPLALNVSDTL